jgi:hypothetical protein
MANFNQEVCPMRRLMLMLATLCIPAEAWGQFRGLPAGSRVRVEAPELFRGRRVGTIMENMRDSMVFAVPVPGARPDSAGAVRRYVLNGANVERVELSRGWSRWRAAERGVQVGVSLGLAYTAVGAAVATPKVPATIVAAFGFVVAASAGVVGGIVGSIFMIEQWWLVQP